MKTCEVATILLLVMAGMIGRADAMNQSYSLFPVGKVSKHSGIAAIEIYPPFQGALLGLEGFSHVIVLYWFDKNDTPDKRAALRVHPRGDKSNPLTGVFACRSPARPNLIGLAVCKIKEVEKGRIVVEEIDAFDGTPVVDIKPYIPAIDSVPDAVVPEWNKRLGPKQ
jgi:tRNA (adenine37-N6)-methyltransferase